MAIVLRNPQCPAVVAVNPILHGEGTSHQRAKQRIYDLIKQTNPKGIDKEHEFPNPVYPDYPWKFDVFATLSDGRRIAIEIDGKVGHTTKRAQKKRETRKLYLKEHGIELYAFSTKWLIARKPLPDSLFLKELGLLVE